MRLFLLIISILLAAARPADAQWEWQPSTAPPISRDEVVQVLSEVPHATDVMRSEVMGRYDAFTELWASAAAETSRALADVGRTGDRMAFTRVVIRWNIAAPRYVSEFVEDASTSLGAPDAAAEWRVAYSRIHRRHVLPDVNRLSGPIVDPEDVLTELSLSDDEGNKLAPARAEYVAQMDAALMAWETQRGELLLKTNDLASNPDKPTAAQIERLQDAILKLANVVRDVAQQSCAAYLSALTPENRVLFGKAMGKRSLPVLFETDSADVAIQLIRKDTKHITADQRAACEQEYAVYEIQRAAFRDQFLRAHLQWQDERDRLIAKKQNPPHGPHPGVPILRKMHQLELAECAVLAQIIGDEAVRHSAALRLLRDSS